MSPSSPASPTPPLSIYVLSRQRQNTYATYGELIDPTGARVCYTLELPWRNNAPNISCDPAGDYVCERYDSPKHRCLVWRLLGVPHRDYCELHWANLPEELEGCIALGSAFGIATIANGHSGPGVLGSKVAFDRFMNLTRDLTHFLLRVVDPIPTRVTDS